MEMVGKVSIGWMVNNVKSGNLESFSLRGRGNFDKPITLARALVASWCVWV